jgi:hypothetical protein
MHHDFSRFKKILAEKLTTQSLNVAVLNIQGELQYEDFGPDSRRQAILEIARQTIVTTQTSRGNQACHVPEYLLYKGTEAFLLILPSRETVNFYIIFCHNGLNVGMTRICVQNTIEIFEKA